MGGRGSSSASSRGGSASYAKYAGDPVPFSTISRAQAGMIFGAYKRGDIDATKQQMSMMYGRYARGKYEDASPTTDSVGINVANKLRATVGALAANDREAANAAFGAFLQSHYNSYDDTAYPDDRKRGRK